MTFRIALAVRYLVALLLPALALWAFSIPQMGRAKIASTDLQTEGNRLLEASSRIERALPPPRPGAAQRLDAVARLKVPGVAVRELSRTTTGRPSIRLSLRGGYRELVSFLDAAWSLPFPGRATSLALAPAPEEADLEGEATIEVEP